MIFLRKRFVKTVLSCYSFIVVGAFAYMEATGYYPGAEARLISPWLSNQYADITRCLTFQWNAYGQHVGTLRVTDITGHQVFWEMPPGS